MSEDKETPGGESCKDLTPAEGQKSASNLTSRVGKYSRRKSRNEEMAGYLASIKSHKRGANKSRAVKAEKRLRECGEYLLFRHYYTIDEVRLHEAHFCKQFRICPLCAMRRASKMINAYMPKWEKIRAENPTWKWYLITLTVKDGKDLLERYKHLKKGHQTLQKHRRNYLHRGGGSSLWNRIHAAVGAYEITIGKNSGEWHPHLHLVVASDEMPIEKDHNGDWRCYPLEAEWKEITGDSMIVNVTPFDQDEDAAKSFCEVFKYALKFSSMTVEDNWEAAEILNRKQLTVCYGAFRGVEISEDLTDEPIEDLPFIELLYRYLSEAESYTFVPKGEKNE